MKKHAVVLSLVLMSATLVGTTSFAKTSRKEAKSMCHSEDASLKGKALNRCIKDKMKSH